MAQRRVGPRGRSNDSNLRTAREINLRNVILIVVILTFPPSLEITLNQRSAANREDTIRIPLSPGPEPEEISVLTFNPSRVSAKDLERWTLFHENARFATPLFGPHMECTADDLPELRDEIRKTEELLGEIDRSQHPKELNEVVRYVRERQAVWLWMAEQELEFLMKGKLPEHQYKEWDLSGCRVSSDKAKICFRVFHDWNNCANDEQVRRLGPYPTEKWKAFLDAFGVRERLETGIRE
jgi:hypothetical protein